MWKVLHNVFCYFPRNDFGVKRYCLGNIGKEIKMKYLNVAEKNDAAKTIAGYLSRGTAKRREGLSTYNKIYEFSASVLGQQAKMVMTSVSGHLLGYEFVGSYKSWGSCNPLSLFDAPVAKSCSQDFINIKKTLEREVRSCAGLIIWTDCDREGENIGFEIIQVCADVKPNIQIYRAKFSEITAASVNRALQTLGQPNANVSNAVDVRQELDLRIGAAFTRFQTLRLQKVFPEQLAQSLVSYGSCQFPTLGFVVERYRAVESFVPEKFWKIKVSHQRDNLTVDFLWKRNRLFDEHCCRALYGACTDHPLATVEDVKSKSKSKWRPLPLDTVELEKLGSRKLKINAKEVMKIAEKLYTQGIISYPRTETNIYPKELDLSSLVERQCEDREWGGFARKILECGGATPRQGSKSDQAHPPIHPTKHVSNLTGNEKKVYDLIVRSFLACCSSDAQGHETLVDILLAGEKFSASGLVIIARNYLEVYPYDKWTGREIHDYQPGGTFTPDIQLADGQTSPPNLLTEADLISLMEKHGIGTDATHAEHIETIKNRSYVALADNVHFVPGLLGMGLVEGYDAMRLAHSFSKPHLRAGLEADLKDICEGKKSPQDVLSQQIIKYKEAYVRVSQEAARIDEALSTRFNRPPNTSAPQEPAAAAALAPPSVMKCPKCSMDMVLRRKKDASGWFISCMGYPQCRNALWLPSIVEHITVLEEPCPTCGGQSRKVEITWKGRSLQHMYPSPHVACLGGCDTRLLQLLGGHSTPSRPVQTTTNNSATDNRTTTRTFNKGNTLRAVVPPNNVSNTGKANYTTSSRERAEPTNRNWFSGTNDSGYTTLHPSRAPAPQPTDSNVVVCACGEAALKLTVKKQTPNYGREFYKCSKHTDSGACQFFLWATNLEEAGSSSGSSRLNAPSPGEWGTTTSTTSTPLCRCSLPAKKFTVQKEGPNKGKTFFSCANTSADKCGYFEWTGEGGEADQGTWGGGPPTNHFSTRGRGGRRRGATGNNGGGPAPGARHKRCGACRQEGHTRNRCPRLGGNE